MASVAKKGLEKYLIQLEQHPLRTKVITAGVMSAISDISAQKLSGVKKLQLRCLLLRVLFGSAYAAPYGHYFHILLEKMFKGKNDNKTVAKKVLLEELISSPWNNLVIFLYEGLVVGATPWVQVKSQIKKDFLAMQYTAWTVSPIIGWVFHNYIPLQFHVVFGNLVGLIWSIFMNLKAKPKTITQD